MSSSSCQCEECTSDSEERWPPVSGVVIGLVISAFLWYLIGVGVETVMYGLGHALLWPVDFFHYLAPHLCAFLKIH